MGDSFLTIEKHGQATLKTATDLSDMFSLQAMKRNKKIQSQLKRIL